MAGKLTNEGEAHILNTYLKGVTRGTLYLGLYTDAVEPSEAATLATITEAAIARIIINNADVTVLNDLATIAQKTFTAAAALGNVTGYFICNISTGTWGTLIFVEHFSDGPYNVAAGESIRITPSFLAA